MKRNIVTLLVLVLVALAFFGRGHLRDLLDKADRPTLASPVPYPSTSKTTPPVASSTPKSEVNLDITFVSQAPHQVWDEEHEEFCEEAALLMASSYLHNDHSYSNLDKAEAALQAIKNYELATFGYYKDTTAEESAKILRDYFKLDQVEVVANPSETQIKAWLAERKVVVVPSAGRELGNPNFKAPGPIYHMLVLKGYTADGRFITNDPGTRKGADYIYSASVILNAMHDWNGGDVNNGRKVVLVVG